MTPREVVWRTIKFQKPDRMPYSLPEKYGSDFAMTGMNPSPDAWRMARWKKFVLFVVGLLRS